MKITKAELTKLKDPKHLAYFKESREFNDYPYLRRIKDARGDITLYKDALDELYAHVDVELTMVCPCAVTLEDVDVFLHIDEAVRLSFKDEDDAYLVNEDLDLDDLLIALTLPEVPIKVVKNAKIEYPSGDGWRVMTEEELERTKSEAADPRLAILKEYRFDDKEE